MNQVAVIGSGFSGLSAACYLAKQGADVTVYEKNETFGGRARVYREQGFTFDMGPSWYWMPDVFEQFFSDFGHKPSDFYRLVQLDPGFQILFGKDDLLKVPTTTEDLYWVFDTIEPGSSLKLRKFLDDAAYKYQVGMGEMVHKPSLSFTEYVNSKVIGSLFKLEMLNSVQSAVRKQFANPKLIALLEFPVLFLGAMADNIPAMYTLMNYSALVQGTWYPMGGMYKIVNAMMAVATNLGVKFINNADISSLQLDGKDVKGLGDSKNKFAADAVIATGDYHHIEQNLLPAQYRMYNERYWNSRTFAPSCLIFYLGVNKRIENLIHHNLVFDADMELHSREIYQDKRWPTQPLFYVCCPSKTDREVAPAGMENLFVLIPVAAGLNDDEATRDRYYNNVLDRLEQVTGESIKQHVVYKRSYCVNDFVNDYHAYKGNAYGLANTLAQTAFLKPSIKNKKLNNLFYAGQLTVPGPGVPPAIISGKLAAELTIKHLKDSKL